MTLTRSEAKAFYDRFGSKQDAQRFYEDRAIAEMIKHSGFEHARNVFEFGCGTGRLAQLLLTSHVPGDSLYSAVDISTTMVSLSRSRLQTFGPRVRVSEPDVDDPFKGISGLPFDRILSTYVLDLLSESEIGDFIRSSADSLVSGGRLSLVSLTFGATFPSRILSSVWGLLFRMSPRIVGGCRPISLIERFAPEAWVITHHNVLSTFGISSEILVAEKKPV
jgi:cyclopropane fatty-acyl-phospholipid synthase-like methyltransferase